MSQNNSARVARSESTGRPRRALRLLASDVAAATDRQCADDVVRLSHRCTSGVGHPLHRHRRRRVARAPRDPASQRVLRACQPGEQRLERHTLELLGNSDLPWLLEPLAAAQLQHITRLPVRRFGHHVLAEPRRPRDRKPPGPRDLERLVLSGVRAAVEPRHDRGSAPLRLSATTWGHSTHLNRSGHGRRHSRSALPARSARSASAWTGSARYRSVRRGR
jgi:hypothetical protein